MKKLFLPFIIFFMAMFMNTVPAMSVDTAVKKFPGIYVPGRSITEFKICQIRRIFCGKTAQVVIAIAVFIIGIMLLNQKLHWGTALVMIVGMIIFYNASDFVKIFGRAQSWRVAVSTNDDAAGGSSTNSYNTFVLNPVCDCSCKINDVDWDWLNPVNWFKDNWNPCQ